MRRVTEYLSRFLHLTPQDKKIKDVAAEVLTSTFPTIPKEGIGIELQNNILFIRGSSSLKHAIQLKKTELMEMMNAKTTNNTIKDIR